MSQISWRRLDCPGHDLARLDSVQYGWKLSGTATFVSQYGPAELEYVVSCDSAWNTRSAQVRGLRSGEKVNFNLSVDSECKWTLNGDECTAVDGCVDLDLGFTPSTNLIPIRRLKLRLGDEVEVRAAWLPFPSLQLLPLHQLYRRERERLYHYEADQGSFVRKLHVNELGFVTDYPGLWKAEPAT